MRPCPVCGLRWGFHEWETHRGHQVPWWHQLPANRAARLEVLRTRVTNWAGWNRIRDRLAGRTE